MRTKSFNAQLSQLVKEFKQIDSIKEVDNQFEELQDANYHSECSLLMAVHYGSEEDVATIKKLIMEQNETLAPNPAYLKRIEITSKFYAMHKKEMGKSIIKK